VYTVIRITAAALDNSLPSKVQGSFWGPRNPIFNGCRGSFPKIMRPGREVDHSPPPNTEVKNEWSYTSTPLYLHVWTRTNSPFHLFDVLHDYGH
jgi:hypothetical protein